MRRALLGLFAIGCAARSELDRGGALDAASDAGLAPADAPADEVVIDAPAPQPAKVTITSYEGDVKSPLTFLAAQADDGAWQVLHGNGGVYSFDAVSRYGVAYVCAYSLGGWSVAYEFVTRDAYPSLVVGCAAPLAANGTIDVHVSNIGVGESANVAIDRGTTLWASADSPVISRSSLASGDHDVVVVRWSDYDLLGVGIRRAVHVAQDQATNVAFDLLLETVPTSTYQLSVIGKTYDEDLATSAVFLSATGSAARMTPSAIGPYHGVPDALLVAADMHELDAYVFDGTTRESREIKRYVHAAANVSLTLPPLFIAGASTQWFTFQSVTGASMYVCAMTQPVSLGLSFIATAAWAGASVDWHEPDLSKLEGWDAAWGLVKGQTTAWSCTAITSDRDPMLELAHYPQGEPVAPAPSWDGVTVTKSTRYGWFVP